MGRVPDEATRREYYGVITRESERLTRLIDNVLDFSRIEAGKVQVEAVATDVRALVDQALNPILPVAQAKGVRLLVEVEPDAPAHCVTDPTRIRQVLLNLLANAVKFTERGTVTLRVAGRSDLLRFVVRDTGIGIDEEQFARVFSAFEQADTSTTRRFGGTGLGLAICKRIVDLMGGTISVASRLGEGSEFTVEVPCGIAPAVAATAGAHDDVNGSGTRRGARLTGLRILLAEDNEVNQLVVQAMLRHEGPEIVTVGDGRLAVEQVRRAGAGAFDLVLMDIQMPVMDGYEATRLVHEIDPDVPVIGQTAHVLNEAIEQCREAGMVAHLSKPIDRHELIGAILRHARVSAEA
jgi:CheY-like chemotaxis protein